MCTRLLLVFFLILSAPSVALAQTQRCNDKAEEATPTDRFENLGEAVKDRANQKLWLRCAAGMRWNGSFCEGSAATYNYAEALALVDDYNRQKVAGRSNWRLPTRDELLAIVEKRCSNPAINVDVFSYSPQSGFWTSTENPGHLSMRMELVHFLYGDAFIANKSQSWRIRLIAD